MNKKLILEIGTKFGKWKIISEETIKKNNLTHWKCECECGFSELIPLNNLMNGSSTKCKHCSSKECGIKKRKGFELISGEMWSQIKNSAKRKNIPFNLRIEEAWDRYLYQNGRCINGEKIYLTGYPYDREKTTAHLSLQIPSLGYYKDNIVWLHKDISKMKGDLTIDNFLIKVSEIRAWKSGEEIVTWNFDWDSENEWWK